MFLDRRFINILAGKEVAILTSYWNYQDSIFPLNSSLRVSLVSKKAYLYFSCCLFTEDDIFDMTTYMKDYYLDMDSKEVDKKSI